MNKKILIISLLILAGFNLSFRWPLSESIMTATFGESRGDHFHDGIDMIGANTAVYPLTSGKLMFAWNRIYFPLDNYWGGGNFKIINHGKNILSVYMHLEDGDDLKPVYTETDILGYYGNTGHSYGKHIHFSMLDQDKRESINPFLNLPQFQDMKSPEILYFYVRIGDKYVRLNENSDIRLTQHYPLLIEIRDTITGRENLGIYKLKAIINGKEILNVEFSRIGTGENGLTVQKIPYDNIFDEKGYYKISGVQYLEGINNIEIHAADFSGNTSSKVFNINIDLDM